MAGSGSAGAGAGPSADYEMEGTIRGYHVYQAQWTARIGETLSTAPAPFSHHLLRASKK